MDFEDLGSAMARSAQDDRTARLEKRVASLAGDVAVLKAQVASLLLDKHRKTIARLSPER